MEKNIIEILKNGGLVIMPTDTQYGLTASALNQKSVEKVYEIRKRTPEKPFIILISKVDDLNYFNIFPDEKTRKFLNNIWPNPLSIIFPCSSNEIAYLHRGTNSLAFRIPNNIDLLNILKETGPLIAPSSNIEGFPYAKTIEEAKEYFDNKVDYYLDKGKIESTPSTLIKIEDGKIKIICFGLYPTENLPNNLPEVVE